MLLGFSTGLEVKRPCFYYRAQPQMLSVTADTSLSGHFHFQKDVPPVVGTNCTHSGVNNHFCAPGIESKSECSGSLSI